MARPVWQNSKGMSLIEVMIAIVLLMIVSLALMQTSLVGYQANLQNSLRDEATRVADQEMGRQRDRLYDDIATSETTTVITGRIRGARVDYTVTTIPKEIAAANSKQITVVVQWNYRGRGYNHSATTLVGKP